MRAIPVLVVLLLPFLSSAQITATGTVRDAANAPLSGATINLKNSTLATTTDEGGKFSLTIPGKAGMIEISFIGYSPQTFEVDDAHHNFSVTLVAAAGKLEEVVISGFATSIKRSNLANAIASVSGRELIGTITQPTVDGALYGKFTGANISANSGAPGGGISLKLRGITSIVANSQPLFIVDGVYFDNSSINAGLNLVSKAAGQGNNNFQDNPSNRVADLDPEDIDRVEILKGASAAAIYGSRAAGGVVIITTKRGIRGKPRIEIGESIGVQAQLRKLGQRSWDTAKVNSAFGAAGLGIYNANNGKTYNYEDELYGRKGLLNNTRLSVSGGNDVTTYYAGVTYRNDDGIVENTGYRKTSFRVNLDQKITKTLDFSITANYVESKADRGYFNNDNTSTTLGVSYVATPSWVNLYPDANGNYPNNPLAPSNFIQTRDLMTNRENVNRTLLGTIINWKLFSSDRHSLRLTGRGGIDYYTLSTTAIFPKELQFEKDGAGTNGASIFGTTLTRNSNINASAVYDFRPTPNLSFRTQAGMTAENTDQNTVVSTATQLIGTQTNVNQSGSIQVNQVRTIQKDRGFFAQEEVNFNDLVIATLGVRGDKSSRNGDANKLYYYPKASVAVNLQNLASWSLEQVNQLKVRAAYGEAGNFAPFGAIYTPLVPAIINGNTGSLIDLTRGNETLGPERQKEFEFGLDMSVLKNRLTFEGTYYIKKVEDLLLNVQVPTSSGFSLAWKNVAAIDNKGIELGVSAIPVTTRDLRWNLELRFWKNTAKVTRLDVPSFNLGVFGASLGTYRIQKGQSPTQLVGIADSQDVKDPESGLHTFGNAEPDFQSSLRSVLTWKNFGFTFLMHWKKGGDNINLTTLLSDIFGTSPDFDKTDLDPGKKLTNGNYRLSQLGASARPWIQDASYFRVREIGLTYRLPPDLIKGVSRIVVGVSGRNLINVFKYRSYDPEVSNFGTNAISSNVDVTPFPSAKSIYFNVSVAF
ncbi:SusC/RagA family TonB-linked outer membrane protein [Puia sp.]|uniref:SusC/RagA family TonB-linked outer membrane protein n=1 Tax=Puia sp. TaxID=2045100 RepID=UPI002F40F661